MRQIHPMVCTQTRLELEQGGSVTKVEFEKLANDEFSALPKLVLFGDELIELDESMLSALCNECESLGY